ncbi:PHLA1 protein, partial [Machaerirhynchus nigripectus]|nr:PHLA1 protein [Machaerirhynchus nigripectus]
FLRAGALPALRLGAGARRRVLGWCRLPPEPSPCGRRPSNPARRMLESGCKAVKEGMLGEKSDGTVDCVERKGKYVYFTVVMAEGKEIDFRCAQEQGWNAAITLQMVQYKNRQAILAVRSTRQKQQHLAAPHGPRLRGASNSA